MVLKRLLPAALCVLVSGCAAFQVAKTFTQGLDTFLVRSVTLDVNGSDQETTFLIWAGTAKLATLTKQQGSGAPQSIPFNPNANPALATDSIPTGATYSYTATFADQTILKRDVAPFTWTDAGNVQTDDPPAPTPSSPLPEQVTGTNLQLKYHVSSGTPTGFYVGVGSYSGNGTTPPNAGSMQMVYSAFLDAASHSTGVAYGTPSDMQGLTAEVLTALSAADARFAKKDSNVTSLTSGKTYAWIVVPAKVDDKSIRLAFGNQAFGVFTVK